MTQHITLCLAPARAYSQPGFTLVYMHACTHVYSTGRVVTIVGLNFAQARPSRRPCQTRQQLNVEGGPWIVVQGCDVFIDEKRLPKHDRLSGPSVALNWIWSASPALRRIAPAGGVRGTRSTQACADV